MTKQNTSLPPRPSQALASSFKTKTEEELFVLKLRGRKCPDPEEDPTGLSAQKSAVKPVDSDQFQTGTRSLKPALAHALFRKALCI